MAGVNPRATNERARTSASNAALFGRGPELAGLRASVSRCGAIVLVGEAGIGKTSLLRATVEGSAARIGGCLGILSFIPYLAISRAVGPLSTEDPALVARDVVQRVGPGGALVLDDLQWADEATLALLERIVGRVPVLGALRTTDPRFDQVQLALRRAGLTELEIGPLGDVDAAKLARRRRPDIGRGATNSVIRHAAGNPLLIEELARDGVTTSLRRALAHRLRGLPPAARDWLEVLAVAGQPVHLPSGAAGLDVLVKGGFATRAGSRMEIRHALIGEVVASGLDETRRRALHRRVAAIVDDAAAARHLAAAGDRAAAVELASRVAETSPPGLRAALLGLAAGYAEGPDASLLRLEAAEALADAGSDLEAERLVAMVEPADDATAARRHLIRSGTRWALGDAAAAFAEAADGCRRIAGTGTRLEARLLVQQAWIATLQRDGSQAVPLARAALDASRALGGPVGPAKRVYATALSIGGASMTAWAHLLEEAVAEARQRGDAAEELLSGKILIASHEGSGDPLEGRRLGDELIRRARETRMIGWEQSVRASLLTLANGQADYAYVVDSGDELLTEPLAPRVRSQSAGYVALALVDLGRFAEARAVIDIAFGSAPDDVDGRFDLLLAQAELALAAGDPARALRDADAGLALFGTADYRDVLFLQLVRAWARSELGQDPGAPLPASLPVHPVHAGTIPESAGIAHLAAGRPAEAATSFASAAQAHARLMRRGELRCLWAEGEALRRAGDLDGAITRLEAVEQRAAALAMTPLLGRIHRSLRLCGARRSARRAPSGSLTTREREILHLVGLGLTNIEIARRIGLGRPSVTRTLSNAMAKLGAESRAHAVVLAAEHRGAGRS